jgi:hypothetical protein
MEKPRFKINFLEVLGALVVTLVLYYVLETAYEMLGNMAVGADAMEKSGAMDWRALLLPLAGVIAFRLMWSRIRTPKAP